MGVPMSRRFRPSRRNWTGAQTGRWSASSGALTLYHAMYQGSPRQLDVRADSDEAALSLARRYEDDLGALTNLYRHGTHSDLDNLAAT